MNKIQPVNSDIEMAEKQPEDRNGDKDKRPKGNSSDITYGIDDVPPWYLSVFLGFQVFHRCIQWIAIRIVYYHEYEYIEFLKISIALLNNGRRNFIHTIHHYTKSMYGRWRSSKRIHHFYNIFRVRDRDASTINFRMQVGTE